MKCFNSVLILLDAIFLSGCTATRSTAGGYLPDSKPVPAGSNAGKDIWMEGDNHLQVLRVR